MRDLLAASVATFRIVPGLGAGLFSNLSTSPNFGEQFRQNEIHAECSMKRVLATLSQATPVLHASNTNSGAPHSFLGQGRELCVSKEKASCGLLGCFAG